MSEEAGYPISFNEFFKAGFPVMLMTVTIITGYVVMVYWVADLEIRIPWNCPARNRLAVLQR